MFYKTSFVADLIFYPIDRNRRESTVSAIMSAYVARGCSNDEKRHHFCSEKWPKKRMNSSKAKPLHVVGEASRSELMEMVKERLQIRHWSNRSLPLDGCEARPM